MAEWAQAIAAQLEWDSVMEMGTVLAAGLGLVLARESEKAAACFEAVKTPAAHGPTYTARKPRWPALRLKLRPSTKPKEGKA